MTIIALGLGLSGALLLVFANLSLGYLVKLVSGGGAPPRYALFMFGVTALNGLLVAWLVRLQRAPSATPPLPDAPAPGVPVSGHYQARRRAAESIVEAAQTRPLSVADVMALTGLGRLESEYLLDDLLAAGTLTLESENGRFVYRLSGSD